MVELNIVGLAGWRGIGKFNWCDYQIEQIRLPSGPLHRKFSKTRSELEFKTQPNSRQGEGRGLISIGNVFL